MRGKEITCNDHLLETWLSKTIWLEEEYGKEGDILPSKLLVWSITIPVGNQENKENKACI